MQAMYRSLCACLLIAASTPALAGLQCTAAPRDKWLSETRMKQMIADLGHRIVVFKVTEGNCYEVYGRDHDNHRIEIYFNPVDGTVVKQNTL